MSAKDKTSARGYGSAHQRQRKAIAAKLKAGAVLTCWRCGGALVQGMAWDLGHDDQDRSLYRGPEHRKCNRSAGARMGNAMRGVQPRKRAQKNDATIIDLW